MKSLVMRRMVSGLCSPAGTVFGALWTSRRMTMGVLGCDCCRFCKEGRRSPPGLPATSPCPSPSPAPGHVPTPSQHIGEHPQCSLTKPSPTAEILGKGDASVPRGEVKTRGVAEVGRHRGGHLVPALPSTASGWLLEQPLGTGAKAPSPTQPPQCFPLPQQSLLGSGFCPGPRVLPLGTAGRSPMSSVPPHRVRRTRVGAPRASSPPGRAAPARSPCPWAAQVAQGTALLRRPAKRRG